MLTESLRVAIEPNTPGSEMKPARKGICRGSCVKPGWLLASYLRPPSVPEPEGRAIQPNVSCGWEGGCSNSTPVPRARSSSSVIWKPSEGSPPQTMPSSEPSSLQTAPSAQGACDDDAPGQSRQRATQEERSPLMPGIWRVLLNAPPLCVWICEMHAGSWMGREKTASAHESGSA